jgi:ABC-type sugar transport system permease subunit
MNGAVLKLIAVVTILAAILGAALWGFTILITAYAPPWAQPAIWPVVVWLLAAGMFFLARSRLGDWGARP